MSQLSVLRAENSSLLSSSSSSSSAVIYSAPITARPCPLCPSVTTRTSLHSLGKMLLSSYKIASNGNNVKVRVNCVRRNVFGSKDLWTFRPTSIGRNVYGANRPWNEMSIHWAKRPWGELSVGRKVLIPFFVRPSDSICVLTPDEFSTSTLIWLWPKLPTKLDGLPHPFVYCFSC